MRISDWSSDVCSSDLGRFVDGFPDSCHMTPNASLLRAIAWMIGALTSFAAMTVSIRELTGEMHAFQMLFIRSAIGVLILLPIIKIGRASCRDRGCQYV